MTIDVYPYTRHKAIVLMYHKIDIVKTDPWGICVSPRWFEQQICFLKNNFNLISSTDLINQIQNENIHSKSVCITFDDGYLDNYLTAKPILEKHNCPATFFIPTAFINETIPFWWNELELIFLHSRQLPPKLCLKILENNYEYDLDTEELSYNQFELHKQWKWYEKPPTDRCAAFLSVWEKLVPLSHQERKEKMEELKIWSKTNYADLISSFPMSHRQIKELSYNKLFTIGMHTHTHADLGAQNKNIQEDEIKNCKEYLLKQYNINCQCLAYPYGRFNSDTIKVVEDLKIGGCFTTEAVHVTEKSNLAMLGRYQVANINGLEFEKQLKIWFD